jgi:hypothetical protein
MFILLQKNKKITNCMAKLACPILPYIDGKESKKMDEGSSNRKILDRK